MANEEERLRSLVRDPGFTPKSRDVGALVQCLGDRDEDFADAVERALARKPEEARAALLELLANGPPAELEARDAIALVVRVCKLVARVAGEASAEVVTALVARLADEEKRVRKAAARALGKMQDARIEAALVEANARATDADEQKVLAEALGKIGGAAALASLTQGKGGDRVLDEKRTRAKLSIERTLGRESRVAIDASLSPQEPIPAVWKCRDGLEELLATELGEHASREARAGRVEGSVSGPLAKALEPRLATELVFPLAETPLAKDAESENEAIARAVRAALGSRDARRVFDAFSPKGRITVRIEWQDGGHKRALTWRVAELLAERASREPGHRTLENDPRDPTWQADVRVFRESVRVELVPVSVQDTRFAYRLRDVPAASHPTIAAALALVARPDKRDVVWDPFCGSGAELVECALRAPGATLFGTDTSEDALAAARENLSAAHVKASLAIADCLEFEPDRAPTIIVTNPPMGRRVHRSTELGAMLDAFILHASKVLAKKGALVWLAPQPEAARATAKRAGLRLAYSRRVDLGGFFAELQRWEK